MKRAKEPVLWWGAALFALFCLALLAVKSLFPKTGIAVDLIVLMWQVGFDAIAFKLSLRLSQNREVWWNAYALAAMAFGLAAAERAAEGLLFLVYGQSILPGTSLELALQIPSLFVSTGLALCLAQLVSNEGGKALRYLSTLLGIFAAAFLVMTFRDRVFTLSLPPQTQKLQALGLTAHGLWFSFSLFSIVAAKAVGVRYFSVGTLLLLMANFYFQLVEILGQFGGLLTLFGGIEMTGQLFVLYGLFQIEVINWVQPPPLAKGLSRIKSLASDSK